MAGTDATCWQARRCRAALLAFSGVLIDAMCRSARAPCGPGRDVNPAGFVRAPATAAVRARRRPRAEGGVAVAAPAHVYVCRSMLYYDNDADLLPSPTSTAHHRGPRRGLRDPVSQASQGAGVRASRRARGGRDGHWGALTRGLWYGDHATDPAGRPAERERRQTGGRRRRVGKNQKGLPAPAFFVLVLHSSSQA